MIVRVGLWPIEREDKRSRSSGRDGCGVRDLGRGILARDLLIGMRMVEVADEMGDTKAWEAEWE